MLRIEISRLHRIDVPSWERETHSHRKLRNKKFETNTPPRDWARLRYPDSSIPYAPTRIWDQ